MSFLETSVTQRSDIMDRLYLVNPKKNSAKSRIIFWILTF
jgi:hypothetical protein